ncbi:MAG: futalosine hydrolase [Planctomycetota bacterium]|nr:futalosine hydrolase [Planctomycetota bacterium]
MPSSPEPVPIPRASAIDGSGDAGILFLVAARREAQAVLRGLTARDDAAFADVPEWTLISPVAGAGLVRTGVGKVNAGAAVARFGPGHRLLVSIGIAGALPSEGAPGFALEIGSAVVARESAYADEGLLAPAGFSDLAAMGFAPGPAHARGPTFAGDVSAVGALTSAGLRVVRVATVSTCSGTEALAREVVRRTGAQAEAMEGAAVLHAGARLGLPAVEVRVISNTTGDRDRQVWALDRSLDALREVTARVWAALRR